MGRLLIFTWIVLSTLTPGCKKPSVSQSAQFASRPEIVANSISLAEMRGILDSGSFAIISAGRNPNNQKDMELSNEDIRLREQELISLISAKSYQYLPVQGHYGGEVEHGYIVYAPVSPGASSYVTQTVDVATLVHFGQKLNQDSVIFTDRGKNSLIFTTGKDACRAYMGTGWSHVPYDSTDNYSVIKTSEGSELRFTLVLNTNMLSGYLPVAVCSRD